MQKIAAADLDHQLIKSAHVIRTQATQIAELKDQLSLKNREEHAEKIASIAVSRGLMSEDSAEDYAKTLADSDRDLNMVEEFVARNSGTGLPLGDEMAKTASDDIALNDGSAEADFNNFLLTSELA